MATPTQIIQQAYDAFGRGDIPALVALVADDVDWEFVGPADLPYAGRRTTPQQVGEFFHAIPRADVIHAFEPREFIESGEHLTVLGWEDSTAIESGRRFQSEWTHVFTVRNDKVVRWRGFFDTAARYDRHARAGATLAHVASTAAA
jgi:ketosteroid isomerase-like protein